MNDATIYYGVEYGDLKCLPRYNFDNITPTTCHNILISDEYSEKEVTGQFYISCSTQIAAGYTW